MAIKKTSGKLYRVDVSDYVASKASLPVYDSTNPTAWKNAFDAAFTREQVSNLTDYSYTITRENDEIVYGMGCVDEGDTTVLLDTEDRLVNMTATVASLDLEMLSDLINAEYTLSTSGTETVTAEAHGTGRVVGTPFKLTNKDHDETLVASVVIKEDNVALILNTDYRIFLGEDGFTYIFPLTAQTGVITADYEYTTPGAEDMHVENKNVTIPRTAFKFVSCAYQTSDLVNPWARDIFYFTEGKLGGDITEKFYKKGDSFEGAEITISCDAGVGHFSRIVGATKAAVNVTP